MKRVYQLLVLPILFACFISNISFAQTIQVVTPSNAAASADEITSMFGGLLGVTAAEIEAFYLDTWDSSHPYESGCQHPAAQVLQMNNSAVQFQWSLPSGGVMPTAIHYLKLSDGMPGSTSSSSGTAIINIPNDLYLFVFQTDCIDGRSAADIVIIDKPVLSQGEPCECPVFKKVKFANFQGPDEIGEVGDLIEYDWPQSDEYHYYLTLYYDSDLTAKLRFRIHFDDDGTPTHFGLFDECIENIYYNQGGTFMEVGSPPEITGMGTITFSTENQLSFVPGVGTSGSYDLRRCNFKDGDGGSGNPYHDMGLNDIISEKISFRSLTNPIKSITRLDLYLPETQTTAISLYNALGQEIKTVQKESVMEAGNHSIELDLSDLPRGSYFCILKTRDENKSIKLLKVE